jgi:hypothetical protein
VRDTTTPSRDATEASTTRLTPGVVARRTNPRRRSARTDHWPAGQSLHAITTRLFAAEEEASVEVTIWQPEEELAIREFLEADSLAYAAPVFNEFALLDPPHLKSMEVQASARCWNAEQFAAVSRAKVGVRNHAIALGNHLSRDDLKIH